MNEHSEHVHHDHTTSHHDEALVAGSRLPRISWGAIFAGLVVTLGLAWLLNLLGVSIGASVADASDTVAISDGLQSAAAIWMILSWLIAFFVGALVAARLAGSLDDFSGMLHGLTLWGVGTIAVVVLGAMGISSILNAGTSLVSATATGVGQVASGAASATTTAVSQGSSVISNAMDTQVANVIQNRLSDSAVEAAAEMDSQLSEQDIRGAINDLDSRTLRRLTQDLMNDDSEGAAELLASSTDLSQQDAEALIDSAYQELEEQFGNPDNEASLSQDLQNQMAAQVDSYIADLDAAGGPQVTPKDVRNAIDRLDSDTIYTIAMRLVQGDERGAKRALANSTNLSNQQIEDIYAGAAEDISQEIEAYQQELNETLEAASTYAQEVLWVMFSGSALALAVALGGGWLGADSARRVYVETHNGTHATT